MKFFRPSSGQHEDCFVEQIYVRARSLCALALDFSEKNFFKFAVYILIVICILWGCAFACDIRPVFQQIFRLVPRSSLQFPQPCQGE